jgi:hypothetical protein
VRRRRTHTHSQQESKDASSDAKPFLPYKRTAFFIFIFEKRKEERILGGEFV